MEMESFKKVDGLKYEMEQRYINKSEEFPSDLKDCIEKFKQLELILNEYHENVNLGAAVSGDGLLTDHGVEHVQMVMKRACQIIDDKHISYLKGYEILILLVAIHFHDVGNISGRSAHEQKISDIICVLENKLSFFSSVDYNFINSIATAHGGHAYGTEDKDTIRNILTSDTRDSIECRLSILAVILRFADELSEDFTRACKTIPIPIENEIYHAYSSSLQDVSINGNTVHFSYVIPYEHTQTKMQKNGSDIYLYDEIKTRLVKCLCELEYCHKYSDGFIKITTLSIKISVSKEKKINQISTFRLRLLGYPSNTDIEKSFDLQTHSDIKYKSGDELKKTLSEDIK
jgi:hypothetical protein